MTFKKTIYKYLSSNQKSDETNLNRLKSLEEIDEIRKINKRLPPDFYKK